MISDNEEQLIRLIYHCENQFLDPETNHPRSLELDVTNDIIFADELDENGEPQRSLIIQQVVDVDTNKEIISPCLPSGAYQQHDNPYFVLIPYQFASLVIDILENGMNYCISIPPKYLDICGRGIDTINVDEKMQVF